MVKTVSILGYCSLAAFEPSQEFRQLVSPKLNGLFFSGRYVDRVWVESAGTYKDRIAVDENQQADIIKMLKSLLRRASKISPNFDGLQSKHWVAQNSSLITIQGLLRLSSKIHLVC